MRPALIFVIDWDKEVDFGVEADLAVKVDFEVDLDFEINKQEAQLISGGSVMLEWELEREHTCAGTVEV